MPAAAGLDQPEACVALTPMAYEEAQKRAGD
jgi:hypothetical protein